MEDFSSWYGNFQALKSISLNVKKNKVTAFIGPSGCGKSTLLRTLLGHVRERDGRIHVAGRDMSRARFGGGTEGKTTALVAAHNKAHCVLRRPPWR